MVYVCSMCDLCKSYVVIGGLGGFGLEFVYWLVERGVCNLVLISCRGRGFVRLWYDFKNVFEVDIFVFF